MARHVYAGASQLKANGQVRPRSGFCRRTAAGGDWQIHAGGLPEHAEIRAIIVHPDQPDILFAGTQHGPYRSSDGGDHWDRLDFPGDGMVVWSLLFHPTDPNTLYAGTAPAAIYRSQNAGESWQQLPIVDSAGLVEMGFPCRVIRLAADPRRPDIVYAGLEVGGVIRSRDGGDTW